MQLTSTLSFVTLAALATAAPVFELIVIRSGSQYQYSSVSASGVDILVGGSDSTTFELNDDSTLVDTKTNDNIFVQDNIFYETHRKQEGSKGFSIKDGYLSYGDGFYACPVDGKVRLTTSCSDSQGSPVALKITNQRESNPGGPSSASSSSASAKPTTLVTKTSPPATSTKASSSSKPTQTAPAKGNVQFGIIATHSGSQFQNTAIKKVPAHPHVFSVGGSEGSDLTLTLKPDGSLVDQDGRGIYVDSKTGEFGDVDPWGQEKPSTGFSISNGHLVYQGKDNWSACPSGDNKFSLANNNCVGGTGISLTVVNQKNA